MIVRCKKVREVLAAESGTFVPSSDGSRIKAVDDETKGDEELGQA